MVVAALVWTIAEAKKGVTKNTKVEEVGRESILFSDHLQRKKRFALCSDPLGGSSANLATPFLFLRRSWGSSGP